MGITREMMTSDMAKLLGIEDEMVRIKLCESPHLDAHAPILPEDIGIISIGESEWSYNRSLDYADLQGLSEYQQVVLVFDDGKGDMQQYAGVLLSVRQGADYEWCSECNRNCRCDHVIWRFLVKGMER